MTDMAHRRVNMVEAQLRTNRIIDQALIQAFLDVPKESFVPESLRGVAYVDEDIPLGGGRYLIEPMILARLIQTASVTPGNAVLDLGCGTGYASAILSRLARTVVGLEQQAALAAKARRCLEASEAANVDIVEGLLAAGYPGRAPYDVILIAGAIPKVPHALTEQLADGGRLVTVLRSPGGVGQAILMERLRGVVSHRVTFDAATPPMPEFAEKPAFVL